MTANTIWLTEIKNIFGHGYRMASGADDYADEPGDHWETAAEWILPEGWRIVALQGGGEAIQTKGGQIVSPEAGDIIPHKCGRPQVITLREGWPVLQAAA